MIQHNKISDLELKKRIRQNEICSGENIKPRIYDKLNCRSGKVMRVFLSQQEALLQALHE
jgi:hypothetical protein